MSLALVIVLNALFAAVAIGGVLSIALRAVSNESRDPLRAGSGAPSPQARHRRAAASPRPARPLAGFAGTRPSARRTS